MNEKNNDLISPSKLIKERVVMEYMANDRCENAHIILKILVKYIFPKSEDIFRKIKDTLENHDSNLKQLSDNEVIKSLLDKKDPIELKLKSEKLYIKIDWNKISEIILVKINDESNNLGIKWLFDLFKTIKNTCQAKGHYKGMTLGIETEYIDRIYRDSYYMHFCEEHFSIDRHCVRMVLLNDNYAEKFCNCDYSETVLSELNKDFIGSIVIRPTETNFVGRSLLNPWYFCQESAYIRTSRYVVNFCGIELKVEAFPYEMQDKITTTCAEVTLLNLLDYYSNQYNDYKFTVPSDISKIVSVKKFDRAIPTKGLDYQTISKFLYSAGFFPKFYHVETNMDESEILKIISLYIESGIPIAMGIKALKETTNHWHSVICLGHCKIDSINEKSIEAYLEKEEEKKQKTTTKSNRRLQGKLPFAFSASLIKKYIIQDDMAQPYSMVDANVIKGTITYCNGDNAKEDKETACVTAAVAPLYKRMYMDAVWAKKTMCVVLECEAFNPLNQCQELSDDLCEKYIVRLFLASSRNLKKHRLINLDGKCIERKKLYRQVPMPKFVWVAELYTINEYNKFAVKQSEDSVQQSEEAAKQTCPVKAFGEIILDATNAKETSLDSIVMINYSDKILARDSDGENMFPSKDGKSKNGNFDFLVYKDNVYFPPYDYNLGDFGNNAQKT